MNNSGGKCEISGNRLATWLDDAQERCNGVGKEGARDDGSSTREMAMAT